MMHDIPITPEEALKVAKQMEQEQMKEFFLHMTAHANVYVAWVLELPKTLVINPEIIAKLSRIEGFYQREELMSQVTASSPMVRHFRLPFGVVFIREDWDEKLYHFE